MKISNATSVLWYEGGMEVDADGAPTAYSLNPKLKALDYIANAMDGSRYVGVQTDSSGKPIVQGPNDPAPGYLVSTTALQDHAKAITDPLRYVNSSTIPYISITKEMDKLGVSLGDVAWIYYKKNGKSTQAIVADVSPAESKGEASIACATSLGIANSPKNGGCDSRVLYVIFKKSSKGWPRTVPDIVTQVQSLITACGGPQAFLK